MKTTLLYLSALTLCGLIYSCSMGKDVTLIEPNSRIDLNTYYVLSPPDVNWHYTTDVKNENLLFWRGVSENLGSELVSTDPSQDFEELIVFTYRVSPVIDSLNMSENYIFSHHTKYWLENKEVAYEQTGKGKVTEISRDSALVEGKKLWAISYKIYNCSIYGLQRNGVGIMYLYFPGNYKTEKLYYGFINEIYPSKDEFADVKYLDNRSLTSLISSFVCSENEFK